MGHRHNVNSPHQNGPQPVKPSAQLPANSPVEPSDKPTLQQRIAALSPSQQQLFRQQLETKGIAWDQVVAPAAAAAKRQERAVARPDKLPLSAAQKHLWVLHQLYPKTTAYHIAIALRVKGDLAIAPLQRSLQDIVDRHESLRTVFLQEDNRPYAKVLRSVSADLPVVDISPVDISPVDISPVDISQPEDVLASCSRHRQQLVQQPFNLETGPLFRARLIKIQDNTQDDKLKDNQFELVLVLHHLIADGWSRGILLRELLAGYRWHRQTNTSQSDVRKHQLSPLNFQYSDYALQQQQWLKSDECDRQQSYWRQQLAAISDLNIPTDPLPTNEQSTSNLADTDFTSQTCLQTFSLAQTQAIKALAQQSGTTVFMLLLAIFKLLLHRYSRQRDIAVGVPVAGRNTSAVEPLIGFFVNTLVLRSQIDPQQTFRSWLKQVQSVLADALQHQDLPFSDVVDAVGVKRAPGENPLFRVMFQVQSGGYQLQNSRQLETGIPGLAISQQWIEPGETKFDMSWHVIERDGELVVAVEYRTQLFRQARIERMLNHFRRLVDAVVASPNEQISQLPLLSESEKSQLLQWSRNKENKRDSDETTVDCFVTRFEQQVRKTPDAIAVNDYRQQTSRTYQQLNQRANKLAHWLQGKGVGPDTLVGICLPSGFDLITALLAVLKAGGAYVPLDPSLPAKRLRYMIDDACPLVLLSYQDCLETGWAGANSAAVLLLDRDEQQLIAQPGNDLSLQVNLQAQAYVIYTSGSTGRPKGTQLTHKGLINYLNWCLEAYPIAAGCGAPVQSSIGFDATITSLFPPLLAGGQVAFGLGETEVEALQAALSKGFSYIKLTPAHLSALQPLLDTQTIQRDRLPKALIIGGEALQSHHIAAWSARYPEVKLFNEYGPTEATVGCCVHQVTSEDSGSIPIGRPISGVQLYILDEYKQLASIGIPGELYIGGAGVAQGYLNQPALTAERFQHHTSLGSGLLYRTGDLATYREDGTIEYLGRFDSQIKLRGFRIEPGEIESVLCQQSQVERAVVMLQEEGGKRELVGYVTALASDLNDVDKSQLTVDLKRRLKQSLPGYMHLAHIVVVDQLPLTVNGKIDRQALPIPTVRKSKEERVSTGPLDRKETILLEIWQQILSSRDISIDENFFDLGGDSISGMQIVSKARENGLKLTPTQLFEHQTIAEQAAVATEIQAADTLSTPAPGPASLGPIQQNFFAQTPSNPHHYNQAVMLAVQHDTNITVLQSALEQLATHHDSLRLRFTKVEGQWQQQYAETITVPLDEFNITSDIAQSVDEIIAGLQASLHLSEGPLFRGALLTRESGKFLLLIAHHLVVDGVSWRLLIEDLSKMYQQITRHEPVSLPAKTTAFSHWTAHLKKHASRFAAEKSYWVDACRSTLPLPVDYPTGSNTAADSHELTVRLSVQETTDLRVISQSVPTILLTGLAQTLKQWSQQDTTLVDVEGHGRYVWDKALDISRTVGWFTALYPLRLQLSPSATLNEQLNTVQKQLDKVPNGGLGYGVLRCAEQGEVPELTSAAEVSFNYLGQLALDTAGFITSLVFEPVPAVKSLEHVCKYRFEIVALIEVDQLQIRWCYSQQQYQHSTVEQLAQRLINNLKSLIACHRQPEKKEPAATSFTAARVDDAQLSQLMSKLNAREASAS